VLLQFLVEAIALSLLGGGIGIALGFGIAEGMSRWMSWPAKVPPEAAESEKARVRGPFFWVAGARTRYNPHALTTY